MTETVLNAELTKYLANKFADYGIIIESASLINIDPDDQTRDAIQKKVTAQQELELAKSRKKRPQYKLIKIKKSRRSTPTLYVLRHRLMLMLIE